MLKRAIRGWVKLWEIEPLLCIVWLVAESLVLAFVGLGILSVGLPLPLVMLTIILGVASLLVSILTLDAIAP